MLDYANASNYIMKLAVLQSLDTTYFLGQLGTLVLI